MREVNFVSKSRQWVFICWAVEQCDRYSMREFLGIRRLYMTLIGRDGRVIRDGLGCLV